MIRPLLLAVMVLTFAAPLAAQETIFKVPSGDILDQGKLYGEFDFGYSWDASAGTYTPLDFRRIRFHIKRGGNREQNRRAVCNRAAGR